MVRPGALAGLSDEALCREALADREGVRGRAAAEELFGRYRRRVYAWCYRVVGERERALDLAQDALARAWRALPSYAGDGPFAGWLFVVVRNRCRSGMRRRSLVRDDEADPDALPGRAQDPLDEVAARLDGGRVLELMARALTPREQEALWLRAMEGLSVEHITAVLGVEGASGARGLLQGARRRLRAALAEADIAEEDVS